MRVLEEGGKSGLSISNFSHPPIFAQKGAGLAAVSGIAVILHRFPFHELVQSAMGHTEASSVLSGKIVLLPSA